MIQAAGPPGYLHCFEQGDIDDLLTRHAESDLSLVLEILVTLEYLSDPLLQEQTSRCFGSCGYRLGLLESRACPQASVSVSTVAPYVTPSGKRSVLGTMNSLRS